MFEIQIDRPESRCCRTIEDFQMIDVEYRKPILRNTWSSGYVASRRRVSTGALQWLVEHEFMY